jgi:hypothetical protein
MTFESMGVCCSPDGSGGLAVIKANVLQGVSPDCFEQETSISKLQPIIPPFRGGDDLYLANRLVRAVIRNCLAYEVVKVFVLEGGWDAAIIIRYCIKYFHYNDGPFNKRTRPSAVLVPQPRVRATIDAHGNIVPKAVSKICSAEKNDRDRANIEMAYWVARAGLSR